MGDSDLGILVTVVIFIILVGCLGWFFVNETTLKDIDVNEPDPDQPLKIYIINETTDGETAKEEGDFGTFLLGVGIMLGGGLLAATMIGAPLGIALIAKGGLALGIGATGLGVGLSGLPGGREVAMNIPFIGQLLATADWLGSAITTFTQILMFDIPILGEYAWVLWVCVAPVTVVGFYLILRFVRGN